MSFLDLGTSIINIDKTIEAQYEILNQGSLNGELVLDISKNYRILACGSYLMNLNKEEFVNLLASGGKLYLDMLQTDQKETLDEYYLCSSLALPLIDVIAAGKMDIAAEISKEIPKKCNHDQGEIEEDFYYYHLISSMVSEPTDIERHQKILESFEDALDGDESIRFEVMTAICNKESESFIDSMSEFISDWKTEMDSDTINPVEILTLTKICIEGIALIRLANLKGIKIDNQFSYIPSAILN